MAIGFAIHKAKRKVSPDLVTRYRTLPVANISDVMSRIAGTNRLRPMHAGGWLGGPALTVKTRPGDNLMVHKATSLQCIALKAVQDKQYGAAVDAQMMLYELLLRRRLDDEAEKAKKPGWGYRQRHGNTKH